MHFIGAALSESLYAERELAFFPGLRVSHDRLPFSKKSRHLDSIEDRVTVRIDAAQQGIPFVINLAESLAKFPRGS
jgi:hypothetical protein